jgi:hypothetical protein
MSVEIRRWHPQVFVDHHGQTASFFFPPTSEPTNHTLGLADYHRWVDRFGRGNAAAFDRHGWNYYVRDVFDFHATGYWDVWPTLQGAIGMTYETDGGGNLALRRDDETVVTMLDGMSRHFTASLATLETAVRYREERLRDMAAFARASVTPAPGGPRAFLLDPADDPVRAAALVENLQYAGVEVQWVSKAFTAKSARELWADPGSKPAPAGGKGLERTGAPLAPAVKPAAHAFANGVFVIDLAQPASRIARALIEQDRSVDSAFARQELAKYERNVRRGRRAPGEGYNFYDITAWALPLSYRVRAFAVNELPAGAVKLAGPDPAAPDDADDPMPDSLAVGVPFTARVSRWAPLTMKEASGQVVFDARGAVSGGEATRPWVKKTERGTAGAAAAPGRLSRGHGRAAAARRGTRLPARFVRRPRRAQSRLAARAAGPTRAHERCAGPGREHRVHGSRRHRRGLGEHRELEEAQHRRGGGRPGEPGIVRLVVVPARAAARRAVHRRARRPHRGHRAGPVQHRGPARWRTAPAGALGGGCTPGDRCTRAGHARA